MKQKLLMKTMLAAAFLGAESASATDYLTYKRAVAADAENNVVAWSDADLEEWVVDSDHGTVTNNAGSETVDRVSKSISASGLYFFSWAYGKSADWPSTTTSNYTFTKSITTQTDSKITLHAVWNVGSPVGDRTDQTPARRTIYHKLTFGDISICVSGQNSGAWITINGTETILREAVNSNKTLRDADLNITMTINQKTKRVDYSISYSGTNGSGSFTDGDGTTASAFSSIAFSRVGGGSNYSQSQTLKSISIVEEELADAADYTVNFLQSGTSTVLKTPVVRSGIVGESISLTSTDMESFLSADENTKYNYASNDAGTLAASGTVVNVYYDAAAKFTYSLKAVDGEANEIKTFGSGYSYEGEPVSVYANLYFNQDDTWYTTSATTLGYTFSSTDNKTITYTTASDVVYFVEAENLSNMTDKSTGNATQSGGQSAAVASGKIAALGSFDAGCYTVTTNLTDSYYSQRGFKLSDDNGTSVFLTIGTARNQGGIHTEPFTLTETKTLSVAGLGNQGARFDYVLIKRVSSIPTTITSTAGFSTLYSAYALDFSEVEGLTAYTATCNGSTVTLTKVNDVPAYTGVVLKGDADTYSIPVITSSGTAQGSLQGSTTAATAYNAYDGYDLYVLAQNASNEAQFTKVSSGSIAAGKAFLKLESSNEARTLNVVYADDEAAGISQIGNGKLQLEDCYYNLNGQRVSQLQKGLYIVNGKKLIKK